MRFTLPPLAFRREVAALLRDFYQEGDEDDFAKAWRMLCEFYRIPEPRVRWRQRIDHGSAYGLTHSDNIVELIRPGWWARHQPPDNTEEGWILVCYHELWHAVTWVDDEQKADRFAAALIEGA